MFSALPSRSFNLIKNYEMINRECWIDCGCPTNAYASPIEFSKFAAQNEKKATHKIYNIQIVVSIQQTFTPSMHLINCIKSIVHSLSYVYVSDRTHCGNTTHRKVLVHLHPEFRNNKTTKQNDDLKLVGLWSMCRNTVTHSHTHIACSQQQLHHTIT